MASDKPRTRQGATVVEMALALSLFVALILGFVDLGYGVFRQHVLSQAARQLARHAIVRGQLATEFAPLGPESISQTGDQESEVNQFIATKLVGWKLSDVQIQIDWIDGGNDVRADHRVRVELQAPYRPIMLFLFEQAEIDLRASSTMYVAH